MNEQVKKQNTILDSKIAKFLSVVLMCVVGSLLVYHIYGYEWVWNNLDRNKTTAIDQSFFDSDLAKDYVNRYLTKVLYQDVCSKNTYDNYYGYYYDSPRYLSEKNKNIKYDIYEYDPTSNQFVLTQYDEENDQYIIPNKKDDVKALSFNTPLVMDEVAYTFTYQDSHYWGQIDPENYDFKKAYDENFLAGYNFSKNINSEPLNLPEGFYRAYQGLKDGSKTIEEVNENFSFKDVKDFHIYRIHGGVSEPLEYKDDLYMIQEAYDRYYPQRDRLMMYIIIEAAAMVALLCFSFTSAGHKKDYEGVYTNGWDRIPFELLCGILFAPGFMLGFLGITFTIDHNYAGPYYALSQVELQQMTLIMMGGSLLILAGLLSTARRLKNHSFIKSTLLYYICKGIAGFFGMFKIVPYTIMMMILLMIWLSIFYSNNKALTWILIWAFVIYFASCLKSIEKAGNEIAHGNLDYEIKGLKRMPVPIRNHGENLMSIRNGMRLAINKEMQSERMKTELITNVSHDIKTPLTSIINYVDLLQKDHTKEQEEEYLEVLSRQSTRLKKLIEDLIEASKASTGNLKVHLIPLDLKELIDQAVAEYSDKFAINGLQPVVTVHDGPISVVADGKLLWRVFSNLFSNAYKYAMENTRIYIDAKRVDNGYVEVCVKNISKEALNISSEELMERFVRGDESRSTEGSGLGLNIAKSLVELMGGSFEVAIDGDLFKAMVRIKETEFRRTTQFEQPVEEPVSKPKKRIIPDEFKVRKEEKPEVKPEEKDQSTKPVEVEVVEAPLEEKKEEEKQTEEKETILDAEVVDKKSETDDESKEEK